jgi:hypothetical protein
LLARFFYWRGQHRRYIEQIEVKLAPPNGAEYQQKEIPVKLKFAIATLLALLLTACAVPETAPTFSQTPTAIPKEGMAVLYLYREYAEPKLLQPTVSINGTKVVSLPQKSFSWIYISPGTHKLSSRWPFLSGPPPLEFWAKYVAGKRYFYEISGRIRVDLGGGVVTTRSSAQIDGQQELEAVQRLEKCCRFISPEINSL